MGGRCALQLQPVWIPAPALGFGDGPGAPVRAGWRALHRKPIGQTFSKERWNLYSEAKLFPKVGFE